MFPHSQVGMPAYVFVWYMSQWHWDQSMMQAIHLLFLSSLDNAVPPEWTVYLIQIYVSGLS